MVSRAALALLVELTINAWHGIGHARRSFLFFDFFDFFGFVLADSPKTNAGGDEKQ